MLRFLGRVFGKCLSVIAWIVVIMGPVCGFLGWLYFQRIGVFESAAMSMVSLLLLCLLGFIIAFAFDIIVFGLMSQIITMRESLERIEERLEAIESD